MKSLCSAVRLILTSEKAAAQKKRTNDSTHFPDFTREEAAEMSARSRRRKSLIIRGIPGNRGQFLTSFRALAFNTIGRSDFVISECTRLNANMVRITFAQTEVRRALLASAPTLAQSGRFSRVFIQPDLTFEQRKQQYRMRVEKRAAKNRNPAQLLASSVFSSSPRSDTDPIRHLPIPTPRRSKVAPPISPRRSVSDSLDSRHSSCHS